MSKRKDLLSLGDLFEIEETISLLNANNVDDDYIGWCSPLKSRFSSPKKRRGRQSQSFLPKQLQVTAIQYPTTNENKENVAVNPSQPQTTEEVIDMDEVVARAKRQLELELTAERNQALSALRKSTHSEYEIKLKALRNHQIKMKQHEIFSRVREYEAQFVEAFNNGPTQQSLPLTPTSAMVMHSVSKIKQQINNSLQQEVLAYAEELELQQAQQQQNSDCTPQPADTAVKERYRCLLIVTHHPPVYNKYNFI